MVGFKLYILFIPYLSYNLYILFIFPQHIILICAYVDISKLVNDDPPTSCLCKAIAKVVEGRA
jgi:hypothetical protein